MLNLFKIITILIISMQTIFAGNYNKAINEYSKENYKKALSYLNGLNTQKANILKGRIYYKLYKKDYVYKYLMPVFKNNIDDDTSLIMLANAFLWDKDAKNAKYVLNKVKNKKTLMYRSTMSNALLLLGDYKKLIKYYDIAIANNEYPEYMKLYKAQAYKMLKKYSKAIKILNELRYSNNMYIKKSAYYELSEIASWQKNFKKSLSYIQYGLNMDSTDIQLRLLKAKIYEWSGDFKSAKKSYSKILNIHPNNSIAKDKLQKLDWVK